MVRLACPLVALLVLAPACAVDDAGQLTADLVTTFDVAEEKALPASLLDCDVPAPCEHPFERQAPGDAGGAAELGESERCIFTALARGEPALVETMAEFRDAIAYLDYLVVGEGLALRQASGESEAGGRWQNRVFACELQAPEFFADCLEVASAPCLDPEQWVVACRPLDNLVCPG
ncbi:MAG TPA: hypothetical protein VIK91_24520 [Nannocystis sp.]